MMNPSQLSANSLPEQQSSTLNLESTLQELLLHDFLVEVDASGGEVAQAFETNPLLPGVILLRQGQLMGMISRRQFLELMSRPYGLELFLKRPLKVLYGFVAKDILVLPGDTLIVTAAQQGLQRSPTLLYEPILVQLTPQVYRLLDMHQLLVAQSQIHQLAMQLLHQQTQAQMMQTEKMASLGRMVAGVAHEILNPVNFIWGNVGHLSHYTQDLMQLLLAYEAEPARQSSAITELREDTDIDFLIQDLPRLLKSMELGAERLKRIVGGLRNFSHMDETNRRPVDLHECLDSTLLILNNRLKDQVEVVKDYGDLPLVDGYSGQLSQVFMNILSNAVDALLDQGAVSPRNCSENCRLDTLTAIQTSQGNQQRPQIKISTSVTFIDGKNQAPFSHWVTVKIKDNGPGIPLDIQAKVFDTFFTTKPVGKGTGLGLAISHQIVTEKHQGQLKLRSEPGIGTEFEICLPCTTGL